SPLMIPHAPRPTLFPYTTLFRSQGEDRAAVEDAYRGIMRRHGLPQDLNIVAFPDFGTPGSHPHVPYVTQSCMTRFHTEATRRELDRKSTRLNSSHVSISYAVFCL